MSKLTRIIFQLSDHEYEQLYHSLVDSEALKSADLLKILRAEQLEETTILERLDVSTNAYYALRSRLNNKIESFYLEQLEGGKNELYKQVANINELILTKSRTVAITTLRKLEKELANNDLFHELTLVYQALKKLHLNTPEYFQYSQLYNKHNAQLLAFEKTETLTAEYFKSYNTGLLEMGLKENQETVLIRESIEAINNRYQSHRIFTFKSLTSLFSQIIGPKNSKKNKDINSRFLEIEKIFKVYNNDLLYSHLEWVLIYLKLLHAFFLGRHSEKEAYIKELDPISSRLLTNYTPFSSTIYFLLIKLDYAIKNNKANRLEKSNEALYRNYDEDGAYILSNTVYYFYRSLSCFYGKNIADAIQWVDKAIALLNIKEHERFVVDLKLTSAGFSFVSKDYETALNHINYVQRILRISEKKNFEYAYDFMKTMKSSFSDIDHEKKLRKFEAAKKKFKESEKPFQSPLRFFDIDKITCPNITQKQLQSPSKK